MNNIYYFITFVILLFFNVKADKNEYTGKLFNNNEVLINAWVKHDKKGNLLPNNWGDDINFKFLNEIFDVNFVYNKYNGRYTNYSLIGSIISNSFTNNKTIIWGSGTQDDKGRPLKIKPKKVLAVRGPLTRKFLINQGIECPEIYGDPAVLLPHFYRPENKTIKYEIGLIPHISSLNSNIIKSFVKDKRVHLIRLRGYQHWLDIIDEILACRYVVSESLHGLIISESYGIPNLWGKITLNRNNIKFHDWFLSIGVDRENPYIIKNDTKVDDIIYAMKNYKKGNPIDIDKLMSVCPFKLKEIKNIKISRN